MREIKFRAYCDKDSEWRYGHYWSDGQTHEILTPMLEKHECVLYASQVDPETLGQYTGRKDKNSVEIYEGDIVRVVNEELQETLIGVVKFDFSGYPAFEIYDNSGNIYSLDDYNTFIFEYLILTVLGNIHDNPELMGSENVD